MEGSSAAKIYLLGGALPTISGSSLILNWVSYRWSSVLNHLLMCWKTSGIERHKQWSRKSFLRICDQVHDLLQGISPVQSLDTWGFCMSCGLKYSAFQILQSSLWLFAFKSDWDQICPQTWGFDAECAYCSAAFERLSAENITRFVWSETFLKGIRRDHLAPSWHPPIQQLALRSKSAGLPGGS